MSVSSCQSSHVDVGSSKLQPVPLTIRFYVYGIQGFCYEILFTALFEFFTTGSVHFKGHSAISSFFIYGSCSIFVERLYIWLYLKYGIPAYIRLPIYLVVIYMWEFTFGIVLKQFDACPWDYSHYPYNFKGVITLEYAPGWLFLCFVHDIVCDYLLRLRISQSTNLSLILGNGISKFD